MAKTQPSPLRGIVAGVAAGLAASLAMDLFQKTWSSVAPPPGSSDEPATVKAANRASRAATGEFLDQQDKPAAGQVVHYAFGATLGGVYGLLAEYWPEVTVGFGTMFGAASALAFDEIAVPAAGLSGPVEETPPVAHAYALASHLVFGGVAEGTRRALAEA